MPTVDSLPTIHEIAITESDCMVVPSITPLRELLDRWDRTVSPYQLVLNEDGLIDGIVDLWHVQKLLATDNLVERIRWEMVTAGTIAETVFAVPNDIPLDSRPTNACEAALGLRVCDSQGCVAIVADGETYVSWSRVSAALRQNHFDPVTHLPPRISFNRRLREELDRAARAHQALAVLLIDLDHFKQINDRFGHRAGDQTLQAVAKCLSAGIRSYDFVARFGGDEFTIICYGCGPADIRLPVVRLQRAIAALPPIDMDGATRISLSIGAAVLTIVDEHCPPEVLLEQADTCLYQSKRSGRSTAFAVELDPFGIQIMPAYEITESP